MAAVLRDPPLASNVIPPDLAARLDGLVRPGLIVVPIRHHSPVCARLVREIIQACRPRAVLVEGPASFTSLIPLLLHPDTRPPIAIYASANEPLAPGPPGSETAAAARRAAYYPFSEYSPELVAVRAGAEVRAALRFIDLDYADQVRTPPDDAEEDPPARTATLLSERPFARSRFLEALARRTGCRDHNDLWDHLFETRLGSGAPLWDHAPARSKASPQSPQSRKRRAQPPPDLLRDIAAWCHYARLDATAQDLVEDGTLRRETAMQAAIRAELEAPSGDPTRPVIAVVGGFHAVALATALTETVDAGARPSSPPAGRSRTAPAAVAEQGFAVSHAGSAQFLVRYGYEQLDALNGYAAGMPSPLYYERLWQAANAGGDDPFTPVCAQFLVELGRLTRRQKLASALNPADEIAALAHARSLARLRGHPGPTREDLLDAVRSCFVKDAVAADGTVLLDVARHLLAGSALGSIPQEAGTPPLLRDFEARARAARLKTSDSVARPVSLDLYRRSAHRSTSRLLHQLAFLDIPFAQFVAGPDFVRGQGLERLHEHWTYRWTPATESRLVETSVRGATLDEAAAHRLLEILAGLPASGDGRSGQAIVRLIVEACRMGLHRHAAGLLDQAASAIAADPSLPSAAAALRQLMLLWESREPLEAHHLHAVPTLARVAYERGCFLLHSLDVVPADLAPAMVEALVVLGECLADTFPPDAARGTRLPTAQREGRQPPLTRPAGTTSRPMGEGRGKGVRAVPPTDSAATALDPDLFFDPLARLQCAPRPPPMLAGAALGLLHGAGRIEPPALARSLRGFLGGASGDPEAATAFLNGLMRTRRELAWQEPAVIHALHRLLAAWSDDDFLARLPFLRLAFAEFTPAETDRLAGLVAQELHLPAAASATPIPCTATEIQRALQVTIAVREALEADGLDAWLDDHARTAEGSESLREPTAP